MPTLGHLPEPPPPPVIARAPPSAGWISQLMAVFARRNDHDERPNFGGGYRPQMPSNSYAAPTINPNQTVPNKLFRFVDFSVEPGKTYQYRMQLLVDESRIMASSRNASKTPGRAEKNGSSRR